MIIQGKLYNGFSHFAGELRCLPFYDHLQQVRLLKDAPQELLEKQIVTLCCVLNLEAIGICSDVLKDIQISLPTIPLKHLHLFVSKQFPVHKVHHLLRCLLLKYVQQDLY